MNTKNKTIALMLAAIMVSAVAVPMAMANNNNVGSIDITVPNEPPEIKCKCECPDEESGMPGTQIWPNMDGSSKTVTICAVVCDRNGKEDISSVTAEVFYPSDTITTPKTVTLTDSCDGTCCVNGEKDCRMPVIADDPPNCVPSDANNPTCKLYCGSFDMAACDPSGEYRVVVTASDGLLEDKMQNRFFYESNVLIEIDFETLNFGDIVICEPSCVYGDNDFETTDKPTIHNYGNDPVVIVLHSEGLKKGGTGDPVDTIKLDARIPGTGVPPCEGTDLPTCEEVTFDKVLDPCCGTVAVDFSIHVEEGTLPGAYSGTIEIGAKHAPTRKVLLENKDTSDDHLYDPILGDEYGELTYNLYGSSDCGYTFEGYELTTDTVYCLIYYPEPWPGTGGMLLGSGTALGGRVTISGTNMPCGLPDTTDPDWDYDLAGGKYAKFWLVECTYYDDTNNKMTGGWHPEAILFDMETIETCPCNNA